MNAAFKTERLRSRVWRAVEAQHRIATMKLVDNSLPDQAILEKILEESKPPVPEEARGKQGTMILFLLRDTGNTAYLRAAGWAENQYKLRTGKLPLPGKGELDLSLFSKP